MTLSSAEQKRCSVDVCVFDCIQRKWVLCRVATVLIGYKREKGPKRNLW